MNPGVALATKGTVRDATRGWHEFRGEALVKDDQTLIALELQE